MMIIIPAAAARDGGKRSVAECTTFDQSEKDDSTVAMTIHNSCSIPVDCAMSWRVVCAPDSKKRRAAHPGSKNVVLESAAAVTAEASATVCGDDAWTIDSIQWSCEPNKD